MVIITMNHFVKIACLLVCTVFSFQANAEGCVAVAGDFPYEEDALYDGFLLGAGGCLYDPKLYTIDDVPPVEPEGGRATDIAGGFINGAWEDSVKSLSNLQVIANNSGRPMVGIRNAARTSVGEVAELAPFSKSVRTIADNIMHRINDGKRIRIWSTSQGTYYAARSVAVAKFRTRSLSFKERKAKLDLIEMITAGAIAKFWPNGPRYVHYVNKQDLLPYIIGPSSPFAKPGRGAVFAELDYRNEDPNDGCADPDDVENPLLEIGLKYVYILLTAHDICAYMPFFEDFDELHSFSKRRRAVRVDLPL